MKNQGRVYKTFHHPDVDDLNADLVTVEFIIAQAQMMRALLQLQKNGGDYVNIPMGEPMQVHTALAITSDKLLRNAALLNGKDIELFVGPSGPSSD